MPNPNRVDLSKTPPVTLCPNCLEPMGIKVIFLAGGREHLTLGCEACGIELAQDNTNPQID
jgi:hypothetical protein